VFTEVVQLVFAAYWCRLEGVSVAKKRYLFYSLASEHTKSIMSQQPSLFAQIQLVSKNWSIRLRPMDE
jgi:hypothetical protein